jgi:two-component system chemotaxis response regulator CheB
MQKMKPDMPDIAIASGCIDFVLSQKNITKEIVWIARAEA